MFPSNKFFVSKSQVADLASRREFRRRFKFWLSLVKLIELSEKHGPFIVESRRLRQIVQSDLNDSKPKPVILVIHAGIRDE